MIFEDHVINSLIFSQYISCPLHKRNFALTDGKCLNAADYSIVTFEVRRTESGGEIQLLLPPREDIDAVLGTEKWLNRQAESEALGLNAAMQVRMIDNTRHFHSQGTSLTGCSGMSACSDKRLEW